MYFHQRFFLLIKNFFSEKKNEKKNEKNEKEKEKERKRKGKKKKKQSSRSSEAISHILKTPSWPAVAKYFESEENFIDQTGPVCPSLLFEFSPVSPPSLPD